jgi:hypothetical protein
MDVFLPVMESAMVIAGHYAKACGRDCVLAQDVCLGLKFAARHVVGKQIGSFFPEIYDESDTESGSEDSESESEEPEWTRYEGDDEKLRLVNECADTWDAWEPETPAERILKGAVEKAALVV